MAATGERRRMMPGTDRLDHWLVAHGQAATRQEAQAAIMAGRVTVGGAVVDKPGRRVAPGAAVEVRGPARPYASRGGVKLAHALAAFGVDPRGRTAVDLGASTGGFTDCLLQAGAARVYAVDVGRGQLAWHLRTDPRVVVRDQTNARHLTPDQVGAPCDLVTADLAFISLHLLWPVISQLLIDGGDVLALVKPQFEAGPARVGRGGVVREPSVHAEVLRTVIAAARESGLVFHGVVPSPVLGPAGNVEFLVHMRREAGAAASGGAAASAVAVAVDAAVEAGAALGRGRGRIRSGGRGVS